MDCRPLKYDFFVLEGSRNFTPYFSLKVQSYSVSCALKAFFNYLSTGHSEVIQVYVNACGRKGTVPEALFYRYVSLLIKILSQSSDLEML